MLTSPVMTMSHWLTEGCRRMSSSDCMKFVLFESGGLVFCSDNDWFAFRFYFNPG